ncbi:MAG: hypothetical protein WAK41_00595 [Roseiarcus sp.]|uniref:hypothetical protein n=1 Tax=Roseiarcus sp. TaxID=1969460 RepID=UPI003BB05B10
MADLETAGGAPSRRLAKPRAKGLDPLVRYMIFHWMLGALGGALCTTAFLVFDPCGIWPLIHDSGMGVPAIFLLYIGFMTSFGGLVCAAAVMFPPDDDEPPRGGLRGNVMPANWAPRLAYVRSARRA